MTDYIDFKNRHLCDPDKEYCVLNLTLIEIPYHAFLMVFHRDQNDSREFELLDNGEAIQQELTQQGWKVVNRKVLQDGAFQSIHYERPKLAQSPSDQPTYIRPTDADKMLDRMEYACLTFSQDVTHTGTFTIEFYDKQTYRKTEPMTGLWRSEVIKQFKQQRWQEKHGMGDAEWVITYFQRPISPANTPIGDWLPAPLPTSIPQPEAKPVPQQEGLDSIRKSWSTTPQPETKPVPQPSIYAPRPKRKSPMHSTGDLENGVEYMKITFFRHDQRIEIGIYGKGIQPTSDTKYGELHLYTEELKKEGWYHVYGTGDSEGILAYLERKRIE
jgi:hypothetical protein